MENEKFAYKSTANQEDNIIIFIEEIFLNLLSDKNPIIILKRTDYNISDIKGKLKEKIDTILLKGKFENLNKEIIKLNKFREFYPPILKKINKNLLLFKDEKLSQFYKLTKFLFNKVPNMNLSISPKKTNSTVSIHGDLINKDEITQRNLMKNSENPEDFKKIKGKNTIKEAKEFTKENLNSKKTMPNIISINQDKLSNYSLEKSLKNSFCKKLPPNNSKDNGQKNNNLNDLRLSDNIQNKNFSVTLSENNSYLDIENMKEINESAESEFSFKTNENKNLEIYKRKDSENSMKILGNKIVRKISGESKNNLENNPKENQNKLYGNYNNDFNFENVFDSSHKDIFLSFENFDENKTDIFGENSISSLRKYSFENINLEQKIKKNEKDKEKDYLSEINDYKNEEKLSVLKEVLRNKKYIESSNIKSIDDNTTVSTKKTKEKIKNIKIKENEILNRTKILDLNELSLKENENNIDERDHLINFLYDKDKNKNKKKSNESKSFINSKKEIYSEIKNPSSNISLKKNTNKLHDDLLETAKYFNLDN